MALVTPLPALRAPALAACAPSTAASTSSLKGARGAFAERLSEKLDLALLIQQQAEADRAPVARVRFQPALDGPEDEEEAGGGLAGSPPRAPAAVLALSDYRGSGARLAPLRGMGGLRDEELSPALMSATRAARESERARQRRIESGTATPVTPSAATRTASTSPERHGPPETPPPEPAARPLPRSASFGSRSPSLLLPRSRSFTLRCPSGSLAARASTSGPADGSDSDSGGEGRPRGRLSSRSLPAPRGASEAGPEEGGRGGPRWATREPLVVSLPAAASEPASPPQPPPEPPAPAATAIAGVLSLPPAARPMATSRSTGAPLPPHGPQAGASPGLPRPPALSRSSSFKSTPAASKAGTPLPSFRAAAAPLPEWTAHMKRGPKKAPPFSESGLLLARYGFDRGEVRELKRIFDAFDANSNGDISKLEIVPYLGGKPGPAGPDDDWRRLAQDLVTILSRNPHAASLYFEDVLRVVYPSATGKQVEMMVKWAKAHEKPAAERPAAAAGEGEAEKQGHAGLTEDQLAEIRALFDMYDSEGRGVLSHDEFMRAGRSSGLTDAELEDMFQRLDNDGNAHMTLDEFTVLCTPLYKWKARETASDFWKKVKADAKNRFELDGAAEEAGGWASAREKLWKAGPVDPATAAKKLETPGEPSRAAMELVAKAVARSTRSLQHYHSFVLVEGHVPRL